jgi:monoterpene epsilon-lactone hydrolase
MSIRLWLVKRQIRKLFRPKQNDHATPTEVGEHFVKTLTALEPKFPRPPKSAHIETESADGVLGDWIWAPGACDDRILFYIHGGGYAWGSPHAYHEFGYQLSKACKAKVFLLDYGLAPDTVAPTQLKQSLAAYDHVCTAYPDASIAIGGDSAGGGLAQSTLIAVRDSSRKMLCGAALIAPWVDLTGAGDSMQSNFEKETMLDARAISHGADEFRGKLSADDPIVSPLFAEQSDMPPMLLQVGQDEILRDDSVRLAEKVNAAGGCATLKIWPKVYHVWHRAAALVPESRRAIKELADFLEAHWAKG